MTAPDAQLTPPARPGHRRDRPPTGYQLPAAARCDGEWKTGASSGRCINAAHDRGLCEDATGFRFLYRAPAGSEAR